VGLYLGGSFALDDADDDSDVDLIVAVRESLTHDEVERLQELHSRLHDLPDRWARHLEGSYFPLSVLRGIEHRDEALWYLDNGARQLILSTHCNTALVRHTLRHYGVGIVGPEARTLIDPVPVADLRAEMLTSLRSWAAEIIAEPGRWANRFYQGFIVLHHCRLWRDLETGSVGTKRQGTAWVKERIDASWHDLIDRAWLTRHDPATSVRTPADPDDYARTLAFVRLVWARFDAHEPGDGTEGIGLDATDPPRPA
jgi:hypothetical protein